MIHVGRTQLQQLSLPRPPCDIVGTGEQALPGQTPIDLIYSILISVIRLR
jgi:hypothetical protein